MERPSIKETQKIFVCGSLPLCCSRIPLSLALTAWATLTEIHACLTHRPDFRGEGATSFMSVVPHWTWHLEHSALSRCLSPGRAGNKPSYVSPWDRYWWHLWMFYSGLAPFKGEGFAWTLLECQALHRNSNGDDIHSLLDDLVSEPLGPI